MKYNSEQAQYTLVDVQNNSFAKKLNKYNLKKEEKERNEKGSRDL